MVVALVGYPRLELGGRQLWRGRGKERKGGGQGRKGGEEGKRERGERKRGERETEKEMSHTVV